MHLDTSIIDYSSAIQFSYTWRDTGDSDGLGINVGLKVNWGSQIGKNVLSEDPFKSFGLGFYIGVKFSDIMWL